jgi:hypothetical protein
VLQKREIQAEIDIITEKSNVIIDDQEDEDILYDNYLKSMKNLLQELYHVYEKSEYRQLHDAFSLGEGISRVPIANQEDFEIHGSIFGIVNLLKSAKERGSLD